MLINEKEFKEDCIAVYSEYAECTEEEAEKVLTNDELENILNKMFEKQTEELSYLHERNKNG